MRITREIITNPNEKIIHEDHESAVIAQRHEGGTEAKYIQIKIYLKDCDDDKYADVGGLHLKEFDQLVYNFLFALGSVKFPEFFEGRKLRGKI